MKKWQKNKEDLKEITNTFAEINKDAVRIITKVVVDGTKEIIYCKHCGKSL